VEPSPAILIRIENVGERQWGGGSRRHGILSEAEAALLSAGAPAVASVQDYSTDGGGGAAGAMHATRTVLDQQKLAIVR